MDQDNLRNVNSMAKEFGPRSTANIRLMLSHARQADTLEVPDPYYGGEQGFEDVLDLLEDSCEGLLDDLLTPTNQH
jgi:protein-tyrosine phosphatase